MGWEGLQLNPALVTALEAVGYVSPTEVQSKALIYAAHPVDLIVSSKTGSGKTLTYLVPILNNLANAMSRNALKSVQMSLILLPTRELAIQVQNVLKAVVKQLEILFPGQKVTSCTLAGGFSLDKQQRILSYGPHLVIATVGRLWDVLSSGKSEDLKKVASCSFLVLDEVDRIIDLGQMKELQQVLKYIEDPKSVTLGTNELTEAKEHALSFDEAQKLSRGFQVEKFDPEFDRMFLGRVRKDKSRSAKPKTSSRPQKLRLDQQETPGHRFGLADDEEADLPEDGEEEQDLDGQEESDQHDGLEEGAEDGDEEGMLLEGDEEGFGDEEAGLEEIDGDDELGDAPEDEQPLGDDAFSGMDEEGFSGQEEGEFNGMDEEDLEFDEEEFNNPKNSNSGKKGRKDRDDSEGRKKDKNPIIKAILPPPKYKTNSMRRTFVVSATLGKTFFTSRMMTKKVKSNLKKLMKENPETVPNMKLKEIMKYCAFKNKTKVIDLTSEVLLPETLEIMKVDCPTEDKMLYLSYFARTYRDKTMIVFTNSISSASRVKSLLALAGRFTSYTRHQMRLSALENAPEHPSQET